MSSMVPVVLVSLPNLPYLLGTFDTTNFKQWWRSAPFPDSLQNIKKGFHIYGRTHLALAQRTDGLWAVYRSKNYGIDWERVFLAAAGEKIYDVVLITFGRAILNTSLGFYETVNAGKDWTLVLALPSAPNAPAFYNIGGGDVLMCTDGRYIWRSTDIARHWTLVCDMHAIVHFYGGHYRGPSNPCIVGANGRVWAANGPFLVRSDNGGLTFGRISYWEVYWSGCPSTTILGHRLYDSGNQPLQSPPLLITELNISSIDGAAGDDVVILIKLDDLIPVSGQTQLFTYIFKSYTSGAHRNNYYKPIFQQFLSPDTSGQHLSSYNVAVLGADYNDKLVFSAQTKVVNGVSFPCLKYSTDGGASWIDIDISKIKMGDPDEGGNYGGSMMNDNFAKLTWIAPPCNNQGYYNFIERYRRQCQSYEMDFCTSHDRAKTVELDAIAEKDQAVVESIDAVLANPGQAVNYGVDALAEGLSTKSYRIDRTCEGTSTKDEEIDAIVEKDQPIIESVDALAQGRPKRYYLLGAYLRSKRSASYFCDVILVRDGQTETVQKMIAKFPQFMDLVDPGLPYEVYNSRKTSS